ncbi:MAG: divalent-cation tolerance protein CutA [Syntrophobacterales bacterium]|nr:divalent-cation tolerance protein CutA [Syntrophobacterales bacterium]
MKNGKFIQVVTTTASRQEADGLSQILLQGRLAACVQLEGPIISRYHWQDKIEEAEEWRCVIKTRRHLFDQVAAVIQEHHSYDVPEIIALQISDSSPSYEQWLDKEIR